MRPRRHRERGKKRNSPTQMAIKMDYMATQDEVKMLGHACEGNDASGCTADGEVCQPDPCGLQA